MVLHPGSENEEKTIRALPLQVQTFPDAALDCLTSMMQPDGLSDGLQWVSVKS
jgi:hypothetical protein